MKRQSRHLLVFILATLSCITMGRTAMADDVHVVSDEIFSFSKYPDIGTYSWKSWENISGQGFLCRLDRVWLNEARTLTPPIKELTVQVETEYTNKASCGSTYGRIEAISPSGVRITPDALNSKDYSGLCEQNCTISSTYKQYSSLGCTVGKCSEKLFFYYLKFPVGTESGRWSLELTIYYQQQMTVGSVTTNQKMKKVILLPEALEILPTAAPTTSTSIAPTTSTSILPSVTTTIGSVSQNPQTAITPSLAGKACSKAGLVKRTKSAKFVCARVGKVLKWKELR